GCWMKPVCLVRSAARSSASAAAWAASSSSENGDTTAGCTVAACGAPAGAGLTTTLRLPPRDGADLKPDASSTADSDISDRARLPATTATAGQGEAGPPRRGQSLRRHIAGGTSLRLRSRQASPARETPARGRASSVLLRLRPAAAAGWGVFSALVQTLAWASLWACQ